MKSWINALLFLTLLAGLPCALFAQWPNYPTPAVPKGADGKPDLTGPGPRTADGKPDLSGIWTIVGRPRPAPADGSIPGQLPLTPPPAPAPATPPPVGGIGLGPPPPNGSQFFNIGT